MCCDHRIAVPLALALLVASVALATSCSDSSSSSSNDTAIEGGDTKTDANPDTTDVRPDTAADAHDSAVGQDTRVDDTAFDTTTDLGPGCAAGERACGASCCAATEVCGGNIACCARAELCGTSCCGAGQVCDGAICRVDCGAEARCSNAAGADVCCASGQICTSGQCFTPNTACADFLDCGVSEYCEPTLGACLPQPGGATCQAVPSGGDVIPTLLWDWDGVGAAMPTHDQVMMAPMVARVDDDDVPDVVFNTFDTNYGGDGVLRVVSGADGSSIFDVTDPAYRVIGGAQVAIGDIDNDGRVEIVTCAEGAGVIAFNHDGTFKWRSTAPEVHCTQAAPAIADLDADGLPEVFVQYTVLNGADGSLRWHKACLGTGGWATNSHTPCDYSTAADLNGDGKLEIVGGNVAYDYQGNIFFDRTADFLDGYPSVGDIDLDGSPDIVVVHSAFTPTPYQGDHWLRILNADGTDKRGPIDINQTNAPAADIASGALGGGGPATIANFDADPEPEIALAGAYAYVVFEGNGQMKWFKPSYDRSSRKTGSSVFDFDGDGVAEAVYNDHYWLRVYDGRTGDVRFCQCNTSATLWEYPVVVDVNNDGHAEIVLASNDYSVANCPTTLTAEDGLDACVQARIDAGETQGFHGIRVFGSPNQDWVGTRPIWNQHTYHVTNVNEDGSIPAGELRHFANPFLNGFRQNVQPGATNLPDVVPVDLAVDVRGCPGQMVLNVRLQNQGWSAAPAGTPATVYVDDPSAPSGWSRVGQVTTTKVLLAGESELLTLSWAVTAGRDASNVTFQVVVNDVNDGVHPTLEECRADNNTGTVTAICTVY